APDWQRVAAKLVHYGMYVALMMIAVTGLAIGVVFTLGLRDGALMGFCIAAHEAQHHGKLRSYHASCCCGCLSSFFA
ncbi:hypothetical protein N9Z17_01040, partial [Planktomarina temperata]|nr:hypothetical protein [Planktomarina temperata]